MSEALQIDMPEIRLLPNSSSNHKAFAKVRVAGCIFLTGIRIVEGQGGGIFISFPGRWEGTNGSEPEERQGKWVDIYYPVGSGVKEAIRRVVVDAYRAAAPKAEPLPFGGAS